VINRFNQRGQQTNIDNVQQMKSDAPELFTGCQSVSITMLYKSLTSTVEVNIATAGECHVCLL
jgi:uncharacterized protein YvpB